MAWLVAGALNVAHATEPVTNTLTVHRIVVEADGREAAAPASAAKPGDVLEYAATLHNGGAGTARGLSATLPLPTGTEFVFGSARPASALASVDGQRFAAMPLTRTVRLADGTSHEELVPVREYRFLRWAPADLPASGELSVRARVAVTAVASNP
jgi:uncharacterized repeat protein (TIGR01451 family)